MKLQELEKYFTKSHELISVNSKTRFECQRCGLCCILLKVPLLNNNPAIREELINSCEFLPKIKNGQCVFLSKTKGEHSCLIYSHKPIVCDSFPFYYNLQDRKLYANNLCPGIGRGKKINLEIVKCKAMDVSLLFEKYYGKKIANIVASFMKPIRPTINN